MASPEELIAKYGIRHSTPGPKCGVNDSGKRELIEALRTRGVHYTRIADILRAEFGVVVSYQTIARHCREM